MKCRRRTQTDYLARALWLGGILLLQCVPLWKVQAQSGASAFSSTSLPTYESDAYIRTVFKEGRSTDYKQATTFYLTFLGRAGETLPGEVSALVTRHVAQMEFLLPEAVRAEVLEDRSDWKGGGFVLKPNAGPGLVAWWRSQDPLVATRLNERLVEHLQRVAFAERAYSDPDALMGFDERGRTYVQLGEPSRVYTYTFSGVLDDLLHPDIPIGPGDLPANEFWLYHPVAQEAFYLFVKRQGRFRLSGVYDLIPRRLRAHHNRNSSRDSLRAVATLELLRDVYYRLGSLHYDFFDQYIQVDDYLLRLEEIARSGSDPLNRGEKAEFYATQGRPRDFVAHTIGETRREDATVSYLRERSVPKQFSHVLENRETLSIRMRYARFLDDDGTTRTAVYWAPLPGTLDLAPAQREHFETAGFQDFSRFVINVTALQRRADYGERVVNQKRFLLTDLAPSGGAEPITIPAQTMQVAGDTGMYHLGLQWDQHPIHRISEDSGTVSVGPSAKTGVNRIDSLVALNANPSTLEMSDLVPALASNVETLLFGEQGQPVLHPYPFEVITPETSLALYFEIYHMTYGADDQTHYEITYEVERTVRSGVLRRRVVEKTAVQTQYTGTMGTAREFIGVDLGEQIEEGPVTVLVRVRDEVTGQQVERALSFVLRASSK